MVKAIRTEYVFDSEFHVCVYLPDDQIFIGLDKDPLRLKRFGHLPLHRVYCVLVGEEAKNEYEKISLEWSEIKRNPRFSIYKKHGVETVNIEAPDELVTWAQHLYQASQPSEVVERILTTELERETLWKSFKPKKKT